MKFLVSLLIFAALLFGVDRDQNIKADYLKSYNYEQMGKYKEAIKVLSPLYRKYPKGYTINFRLGWLFFLSHSYTNAIKHYKSASLISTKAIDPRLGLIRSYLAKNSYKKSEMIAYEILKIDFYNYYANYYMIRILRAEEKYVIAQEICIKMLTLYPTDILFLEQLARIYKATNSPYLKNLYKDILILDPNNIFVNLQMHKI